MQLHIRNTYERYSKSGGISKLPHQRRKQNSCVENTHWSVEKERNFGFVFRERSNKEQRNLERERKKKPARSSVDILQR